MDRPGGMVLDAAANASRCPVLQLGQLRQKCLR
jgi:hypothetical protein